MSQSCHDLDIQSLQQFSEMIRSEVSFDEHNNHVDAASSRSNVKDSLLGKSPLPMLQQSRPKTSQPVDLHRTPAKSSKKRDQTNNAESEYRNVEDIEVDFQGFEKDTSLAGTAKTMSKKFQVMDMDKSMKSSQKRISGGKKL